ncbi:hypothetical protein IAR50_002827 [Cryptococcus sp. DSM 104548]
MFVTIAIGANDTWESYFGDPNVTATTAVNLLREHVPKLIVNIFGIWPMSDIYNLTLTNPYCQTATLRDVPHLSWECACAVTPGPKGDATGQRTETTGDAYDNAVLELVREWEAEDDDGFGIMWQPGSIRDYPNFPI